jgi:HEAT repeat protein
LGLFFSENKQADYDDQIPVFIKELVRLFTDEDRYVLDNVRDCLSALVKSKPLEELLPHMDFTRNYIVSLISEARHRKGAAKGPDFFLPLFNIPKGIEPLLVFYQHGLLNGTSAQREMAASGIGDLVEYTSPQELKPFLIKMTGPLIRVVGDKFPGAVKAAILQSLRLLLEKGGASQKPFVPQLQKSFVKALGDPTTAVRARAALALGQLMELSTRVDPLVTDLINSASSPDHSPEVAESYLTALGSVFSSSGAKVSLKAKETAIDGLMALVSHSKDNVRVAAATALSSVAIHLHDEKKPDTSGGGAEDDDEDDDDGNETLDRLIVLPLLQTLNESGEHWQLKHGVSQALTMTCISVLSGDHSLSSHYLEILNSLQVMVKQGYNKNVYLQIHGCEAIVLLCKAIRKKELTTSVMSGLHTFVSKSDLFSTLLDAFSEEAPDVKVSVLICLKNIAKSFKSATRSNLHDIMPCLLEAVKDTNIRVKLAAERALIHALEVHTRATTLDEFASSVDNTTARFVRDYVRKVLVRLQPDSDTD